MDKHNLFHPPLPVKNLRKNKKKALLINGTKNGKFNVVFLSVNFKHLPKSYDVPVKEFSKFLDSPACRRQKAKAVFFLLADDGNNSNIVDLEIRQMVYEEVTEREWPIYLFDSKTLSITSMLCSANLTSIPGDVIISALSTCQMIAVSELQRKQEEYSYISYRMINRFNRNVNELAAECLGTRDPNPKYVIVCGLQCNDLVMSLKSRVVPSKNVIYVDPEGSLECTPQVLKTFFDHGYNQIIPFTLDTLAVTNVSNFTSPEQAVMTVDNREELPLEKFQIVPKSKKAYYVTYVDKVSERYKPAGEAKLSYEQGHRIQLALVIDRNSLPFLYQEPFIIPEIEALPKKLATQPDLNVPVISFFDNSSVICVNDENGYMFLNEWNGLFGYDLYISFEEEVPTMITDLNKVRNKDPFVVYDLVKVLSMPAQDLKVDSKWGFKVTSNNDNPVLLEHDTFFGVRKVATPVFMMALLLKHHIKAIKKETGKKPKKVGFKN